jgi:multiple sugar transport system substrate-binding protein
LKTVAYRSFIVLLVFILILTGCGGTQDKPAAGETTETDTTETEDVVSADDGTNDEGAAETEEPAGLTYTFDSSLSGEITVWSFGNFGDVIPPFNKLYPNIKVTPVVMDFGQMHDKLQTVLAAGSGAPDVVLVEQFQFPRYVAGGVLEDLTQPPYNADRFKSDISVYNWERWKSVDGKKLLGMPFDVTPGVLYYRADIYEELGLPSDPEELGEYIQDADNLIALAQTLKANNKYFMEWGDGPVHWGGDAVGYFDEELNWLRNTDELARLLDVTKRGEQIKWAPYESMWGDKGKQMIKKGELTGLVLGSWGAREIKRNFPELAGKWRATNLPLGINAGLGGSAWVIPSQSQNKKAAFAYVEFISRSEEAWKIWVDGSTQPGWKHINSKDWYINHTNEYLGGQEDIKFYRALEDKIPVRRLNPLDGKAWPIWLEGVQKAIKNNLDSKAVLQEIEENIKNKLQVDINKLREQELK